MPQVRPGDRLDARTLTTITGEQVAVPAAEGVVHLQFRRFAGCPICHRHVHEVATRAEEIAAAGVTEVVLFSSPADKLREYESDLPFAVVADPDRVLYDAFGVGSSVAASLHPKAAAAAVRGMLGARSTLGALDFSEPHWGKPADVLVGPDGTVLASHYGKHPDDQWSVDELLSRAAARA